MNEFHTTHSIEQTFQTDHGQRLADAAAHRTIRPLQKSAEPSPKNRRRRLVATAAATALIVTGGISASLVSAGSASPQQDCSRGGQYSVGCTLISGRADGWFVPGEAGPGTSAASGFSSGFSVDSPALPPRVR